MALEGCAPLYAPFAGTVRCAYQVDFANSSARVVAEITTGHYRFLIVPQTPIPRQIVESFKASEIYRDAQFVVFDLGAPPLSR
jgi:hypothetical protein